MTFLPRTAFFAFALTTVLALSTSKTSAQQDTTDLLSMLGEEDVTTYTMATFKSTRVINGQSIENVAGGVLDFRVSHRFGTFNSGPHKLYGLDIAQMRLAFEYGINDRLMVGVGRSNVNEEVDAFVKYKILRQSSGSKNMPITLSWFSSIVSRNTEWANKERKNYFTSRLYYCHQLLIGRKMNERLSLQLTPTLVHRNLVATKTDKNDIMALGGGGRYKLTQRTSINAEYFYVLPNQLTNYVNSLSLGIDLETGGHVFQLHVTNSAPMNEKGFITETTGKWSKGDIQFGFNISRVFTVREKKEPRD
jgi:hypothetical protein